MNNVFMYNIFFLWTDEQLFARYRKCCYTKKISGFLYYGCQRLKLIIVNQNEIILYVFLILYLISVSSILR